MTSVSKLVDQHLSALLAAAAEAGIPRDSVARTLLDRVMGIYRETRTPDDIRSELSFVAQALDDDEEYPFMRP